LNKKKSLISIKKIIKNKENNKISSPKTPSKKPK
jgi:hypothetical protein